MYKFVVLFALFACVMAAPKPQPGFIAPAVPVATNYANTVQVASIYGVPLSAINAGRPPVVVHSPFPANAPLTYPQTSVLAQAPVVGYPPVLAHNPVVYPGAPVTAHPHIYLS